MQNSIVDLIRNIATQYNVSQEKIAEILSDVIVRAYNKQIPDQIIEVKIDLNSGKINANKKLKVINDTEDYDDFVEIPISEAKKYGNFQIDDTCLVPFDIFTFFKKNEIATIMQVFKQKLLEINNVRVYEKWFPHLGEIISCIVEKHDTSKGFYIIDLDDGNMGFMSRNESIPGESLIPGGRYQFYIKEVKEQSKGWPIILSRADARFVLKLLEIEVPEIASGEIKVEAIERIAGFKTKIAVSSQNTNYDPASVVVGQKGNRIKAISDVLNGEKIEVMNFIEDKKQMLINAIGANNLVGINYVEAKADNEQPYATLITIDKLLPVIIGKKGNNIKLISKLINCSIDINTIEEAKERKIDFEQINNPEALLLKSSGSSAGGHRYQTTWSNHASAHAHKQQPTIKPTFNNEILLDDISNLSKEELEEKYSLKLNIDINDDQAIHNQNDDIELLDEEIALEEFKNDDLANAFADEIANLEKNEKK